MGRPRINGPRGSKQRSERMELARELRGRGMACSKIAIEIGVTEATVQKYFRPHNSDRDVPFRGKTARCAGCGERKTDCVRYRRGWWCRSCLTADDPEAVTTLESIAEGRNADLGGSVHLRNWRQA
jgi:transposase